MSREYPCIYFEEDGVCRKLSSDTDFQYCMMGPCPEQKLSNADRIRAMSDEELAKWIRSRSCCHCCDICMRSKTHTCSSHDGNCITGIVDWLQQPAKEDT